MRIRLKTRLQRRLLLRRKPMVPRPLPRPQRRKAIPTKTLMTLMTLMRILMRMRTLLRKRLPRKQPRPRKRSHLTKTLQKRTRRKPNPLPPAKNAKMAPPLLPRPPISDPNLNPPAE
jgi:hypothetical protein